MDLKSSPEFFFFPEEIIFIESIEYYLQKERNRALRTYRKHLLFLSYVMIDGVKFKTRNACTNDVCAFVFFFSFNGSTKEKGKFSFLSNVFSKDEIDAMISVDSLFQVALEESCQWLNKFFCHACLLRGELEKITI